MGKMKFSRMIRSVLPTIVMLTSIVKLASGIELGTKSFLLIRYILNNGEVSAGSTSCTQDEFLQINAAFPDSMQMPTRRHLRSNGDEIVSMTSNSTNSTTTSRELWPTFCADACDGFLPGTCRATRCVGYRRSRDLLMSQKDTDFACSKIMNSINATIDRLMRSSKIGTTCKNFLEPSTRRTLCGECGE